MLSTWLALDGFIIAQGSVYLLLDVDWDFALV
jgi:hypothetical protein